MDFVDIEFDNSLFNKDILLKEYGFKNDQIYLKILSKFDALFFKY